MITTANYLDYFLKYVDKELLAHEVQWVNNFVNQNAIYKNQLEQLLLTALHSEPIIAFKQHLYRPSIVTILGINETNYLNYFTAAIDNELNKTEADALNQFIYKNPILQLEFETLKNCTLPNTTIIYKNKALLLKNKNNKKRIYFFTTIATAAILIISAGSFWLYTQNNNAKTYVVNNISTKSSEFKKGTFNNDTIIYKPNSILKNKNKNIIALKTLPKKQLPLIPINTIQSLKAIVNNPLKNETIINNNNKFSNSNSDALSLAESKTIRRQLQALNNIEDNVTIINSQRNIITNNNISGTLIVADNSSNLLPSDFNQAYSPPFSIKSDNVNKTTKKKNNFFNKLKAFRNKINGEEEVYLKVGNKIITL